MLLQEWSDVLVTSFANLWTEIIAYVPSIFVSVLIFVIGWVFAGLIGRWVATLIKLLKLDTLLQSIGIQDLVNKAGYQLDIGVFIGSIIKLFIIVVFLVASLDVLGLSQINTFLQEVVLNYIPNVLAATLILLLAAVIADVLRKVVVGGAKAAGVVYADLLGGITKWLIWIFALLTAFNQIGIGAVFAQTLFTGLVAMLALAGGLAFGLGGKDAAAQYIEKLRADVSSKKL